MPIGDQRKVTVVGNKLLLIEKNKNICTLVLNLLLNSSQPHKNNIQEAESITEAAFLSEDLKEGRLAFLEKRKPRFKGK